MLLISAVSTVCSVPLPRQTVTHFLQLLLPHWTMWGKRPRFSILRRNKEAPADQHWPCNSLVTLSPIPFCSSRSGFGSQLVHCHTLLASSQRSKDCVWPGCRDLQLWHGNSSWGTLKRQVHLGGAAPTASWANWSLLHLALRLALWLFFGSAQALDLSVHLIFHGEQKPSLWAVHYPTQELYAPCKAQNPLLSQWLNFPRYETWIRSAENHAGIIKDTCRW